MARAVDQNVMCSRHNTASEMTSKPSNLTASALSNELVKNPWPDDEHSHRPVRTEKHPCNRDQGYSSAQSGDKFAWSEAILRGRSEAHAPDRLAKHSELAKYV